MTNIQHENDFYNKNILLNKDEIFLRINGYDYSISNYGRVLSHKTNKILRLRQRRHGYFAAMLYVNNTHKAYSIHRLVAQYFCSNENNFNEVNHKDGNKQNNHYSNLEWCTHKQNARHSFDVLNNKSGKHGTEHHLNKLTEQQVKDIRSKYIPNKYGFHKIAKEYGLCKKTVMYIVKGLIWKSLL